jgi:Tfp pilus assembly protein PilZ
VLHHNLQIESLDQHNLYTKFLFFMVNIHLMIVSRIKYGVDRTVIVLQVIEEEQKEIVNQTKILITVIMVILFLENVFVMLDIKK